jgi:hypothetical protein
MLERLRAEGAFDGPAATARTARALLQDVHADAGTSVADLVSLGLALRRLSPERTEFVTVPIADWDHRVPKYGSTVRWHPERSGALWQALRADRRITGDRRIQPAHTAVGMPPGYVQVRADDARVAAGLRASGFVVVDAPAAPAAGGAGRPRSGPTVITYDPSWKRYVSTLATALPGAELRAVPGHGRIFDVAVGTAGRRVVKVTYDRSGAEGPPVTADRLRCRP